MLRSYVETEAANPGAMLEMGTKYGVITRRWTDAQLAVFEKAWIEVLQEDAKKDPLFKETFESYSAFRKIYAKWGDAQALKATYQ
jgi:TRAP-type mannitol/chloroaromatic compound transport system substrate-binding protein